MVVKQIKKQALKKNENPVSAVCPDISLRKIVENRPELKQIITAWPERPGSKLIVMPRNRELSDDIAYRFPHTPQIPPAGTNSTRPPIS